MTIHFHDTSVRVEKKLTKVLREYPNKFFFFHALCPGMVLCFVAPKEWKVHLGQLLDWDSPITAHSLVEIRS